MSPEELTSKFASAYSKKAEVRHLSSSEIKDKVRNARGFDEWSGGNIPDAFDMGLLGYGGLGAAAGGALGAALSKKKDRLQNSLLLALLGGGLGAAGRYLYKQSADDSAAATAAPGVGSPSTAGTASIPYYLAGNPQTNEQGDVSYPFTVRQDYGPGAFYNPANAGFWAGSFGNLPNFLTGQSGVGTGGALLTGTGAYLGAKGLMNRGLLNPASYQPGLIPSLATLQQGPAEQLVSRMTTTPATWADLFAGRGNFAANTGAGTPGKPAKDGKPATPGSPSVVMTQPHEDPAQPARRAQVTSLSPSDFIQQASRAGIPAPGAASPLSSTSNAPISVAINENLPGGKGGTTPVQSHVSIPRPNEPMLSSSGSPTWRGRQAVYAPEIMGGLPTGPRGLSRWAGPAAFAMGFGIPMLSNLGQGLFRESSPEQDNSWINALSPKIDIGSGRFNETENRVTR